MYQRLGHLHHLLGEARASDKVATNLMRYWEKKLVLPEKRVLESGEVVYDWYDDFVRAFHAHSPGATFALDQIDDDARNMLAIFGNTEKGWIWKVGFDGPAPRGNFARGNIIELDLFYNGDYKGYKYLDIGNSGPYEPVDFSLGSVLVQETSTAAKVENRITAMGVKLDKLAQDVRRGIDEGSATSGLFDVRVPDTGDISVADYVSELNIRARQAEFDNGIDENTIEIIVNSYGSWLD